MKNLYHQYKINFIKVIFIFVIGFITRILVNYYGGIDIFAYESSKVYMLYYILIPFFIIINELIYYFQFSIFSIFKSLYVNKIPIGNISNVNIISSQKLLNRNNINISYSIVNENNNSLGYKDKTRRFVH